MTIKDCNAMLFVLFFLSQGRIAGVDFPLPSSFRRPPFQLVKEERKLFLEFISGYDGKIEPLKQYALLWRDPKVYSFATGLHFLSVCLCDTTGEERSRVWRCAITGFKKGFKGVLEWASLPEIDDLEWRLSQPKLSVQEKRVILDSSPAELRDVLFEHMKLIAYSRGIYGLRTCPVATAPCH